MVGNNVVKLSPGILYSGYKLKQTAMSRASYCTEARCRSKYSEWAEHNNRLTHWTLLDWLWLNFRQPCLLRCGTANNMI